MGLYTRVCVLLRRNLSASLPSLFSLSLFEILLTAHLADQHPRTPSTHASSPWQRDGHSSPDSESPPPQAQARTTDPSSTLSSPLGRTRERQGAVSSLKEGATVNISEAFQWSRFSEKLLQGCPWRGTGRAAHDELKLPVPPKHAPVT